MSKTIWVINQYACSFADGNPSRSFFMAKILADRNNQTRLIAASYSHLQRFKREKPTYEPVADNCEITWIKVLQYKRTQSILRMINWLIFAIKLIFLRRRGAKPDIIIYSSPSPVGYLGAFLLAKRHGSKIIFDVRDIWPLTLISLGNYSRRNIFIKLLDKIETLACQSADLVISNLPGYDAYMNDYNKRFKKFAWIKNGVKLEPALETKNGEDLHSADQNDRFTIGYMGSIGLSNNLNILVEAAYELRKNTNIHFVICGEGNDKYILENRVIGLGLTNVTFKNAVKKEAVMAQLRSFDLCYIGWLESDIYNYGIAANKIPEYMASGTPIINSYSGKYDPINEFNCGWTIRAGDPLLLAAQITKISEMPVEDRRKIGKKGQNTAFLKYDYNAIVEELEKLIKAI